MVDEERRMRWRCLGRTGTLGGLGGEGAAGESDRRGSFYGGR